MTHEEAKNEERSDRPVVIVPLLAAAFVGVGMAYALSGAMPTTSRNLIAAVSATVGIATLVLMRGRQARPWMAVPALLLTLLVIYLASISTARRIAARHDHLVTIPAGVIFSGNPMRPSDEMRDNAQSAITWYRRASLFGDGGWSILGGEQPYLDQRIAWMHAVRFEYDEAEQVLRRGVEKRGQRETYVISIARVIRGRGEFEEALELYERTLTQEPGYTDLLDEYIAWIDQEGLYMRAAMTCEARRVSIPEGPEYDEARLHVMRWIALLLERLGRFEESIQVTRDTIEIDDENPNAYLALGRAIAAHGDAEEGLAAVEKALTLDESLHGAHVLAAELFSNLGDDTRAAHHRKRAEETHPDL